MGLLGDWNDLIPIKLQYDIQNSLAIIIYLVIIMMMAIIITFKNASSILVWFSLFLSWYPFSCWLVIWLFSLILAFLLCTLSFSTVEKSMGPTRKKIILSWMKKEGQCRHRGRAPHSVTATAVVSPSVTSLPLWVGWDSAFPLGSGAILVLPSWKWSTTALSMLMENRKFRSVSVHRGSSFGHSCVNTSLCERKHCTAFIWCDKNEVAAVCPALCKVIWIDAEQHRLGPCPHRDTQASDDKWGL